MVSRAPRPAPRIQQRQSAKQAVRTAADDRLASESQNLRSFVACQEIPLDTAGERKPNRNFTVPRFLVLSGENPCQRRGNGWQGMKPRGQRTSCIQWLANQAPA